MKNKTLLYLCLSIFYYSSAMFNSSPYSGIRVFEHKEDIEIWAVINNQINVRVWFDKVKKTYSGSESIFMGDNILSDSEAKSLFTELYRLAKENQKD